LIAAAPALLEVAKLLLFDVSGNNATERATRAGYSASPLYASLQNAIKAARAAITAATVGSAL
jgi:hypothetical protein